MSRPSGRSGRTSGLGVALPIIAATLLVSAPAPLSAQQSAEELKAKLDSLRPLVEEARREVDAFREAREAAEAAAAAAETSVDTLRIGSLTVLAPVGQSETARELFGEVWSAHFSDVERSPALDRTPFVFQWSRDHVPVHVATSPNHRLEFMGYHRRSHVTERIHHAIARSLTLDIHDLDTGLDDWLIGEPHRLGDESNLYRHLATATARAARDCYVGDVQSCISALDLERPNAPLEAWYTAEERRALVGRNTSLGIGRDRTERWNRCVREGDAAACGETLLRGGNRTDPAAGWAPLRGPIRASVVRHALEVGGAGAWGRLFDEEATTPVAALEHASGMPIEQLVAGWHDRMMAARPEIYAGILPKSGLALLWVLFFAALAMRSTRWRLG